MLNGQEEPEGKVARAAKTNFLAQDPHSPGSFLFARGELRGTGWGWYSLTVGRFYSTLRKRKKKSSSLPRLSPRVNYFFCWVGTGQVGEQEGADEGRRTELGGGGSVTGQDVLKILPVYYPSKNWPLHGCRRPL